MGDVGRMELRLPVELSRSASGTPPPCFPLCRCAGPLTPYPNSGSCPRYQMLHPVLVHSSPVCPGLMYTDPQGVAVVGGPALATARSLEGPQSRQGGALVMGVKAPSSQCLLVPRAPPCLHPASRLHEAPRLLEIVGVAPAVCRQ